jgi:leucine-rich repeat protein SHOC2
MKLFLILLFAVSLVIGQDLASDQQAVRVILDANGWNSVAVSAVSTSGSRITALNISTRPAGSPGPLTTLPAAIGNLTSLTTLNLSNNQISSLPTEIGNLTNLTTLNLSNNELSSLPTSIGNLTSLTHFYVQTNQLSSLPSAIGSLTNLRQFFVHYNNLTSLPAEIVNLTKIHEFQAQFNQLSSLPDNIGNMGSRLSSVPNWWDLRPEPTYRFDHNQLTSVPASLGNIYELSDLKLGHNRLTSIPSSIITSGARILEIQHNQITSLPDVFNSGFFQFYAHNNELTTIPASMGGKGYYMLFLNDNKISSLPDAFGSITSMYDGILRLQNNLLTSIPNTIGSMNGLAELDLSGNQLTSLPSSMGNTSLRRLFISNNQLSALPDQICNISGLSWLVCENNQLTDLPDCITSKSYYTLMSSFNYNRLCNISSAKQSWLDGLNDDKHLPWDNTQMGCGTVENYEQNISQAPVSFSLARNVPNPFKACTQINFMLPEPCRAKLEIFRADGALVQVITDRKMAVGHHSVQWNGSDLGAGIYFYKLTAGKFKAMKKCILIK